MVASGAMEKTIRNFKRIFPSIALLAFSLFLLVSINTACSSSSPSMKMKRSKTAPVVWASRPRTPSARHLMRFTTATSIMLSGMTSSTKLRKLKAAPRQYSALELPGISARASRGPVT